MPVTSYSTTAANNNAAAPNGAPEGWAPSAVNDTIRQIMADVATEAQKNAVKVLGSVAGTNTITGSMSPALVSYSAGMLVVFTPANNNTGATTLNVNSLGALDIQKFDGEALVAGDLVAGIPALMLLDAGADDFILLNPQAPQASSAMATDFGYKGLPQQSQVIGYTLVLADAGKHVVMNGVSIALTIPANASVAFPIGTAIAIFNSNTTDLSIAITTDSLILVGTTTTGTRTLARNGLASLLKLDTTTWVISGAGLS